MDIKKAFLETQMKKLIKENAITLLEEEDINDNTDLINEMGFDSVSIIRLIVDIEHTFDIEIDDEYLVVDMVSTFGALKKCVASHLGLVG